MANKVTADMTIYDVLCLDPENEKIAQVFFDMGTQRRYSLTARLPIGGAIVLLL